MEEGKGINLANSVSYLSRNACLTKAKSLKEQGYCINMSQTDVAKEIHAHKTEVERLYQKEQDQYKGLFNVSGEPENYSILAIDADKDFGLVYAIKPDSEGTSITYVEVIVPGNLGMILGKYLPEKYQLKDMNMSNVNKIF